MRLFLATTPEGIARAEGKLDGDWSVGLDASMRDARCLAADPLNADVVYAGTQGRGVFRSGDRGRTWLPAGMDGRIVKAIALSRHERNTIYAGTKPALMYVSRDGGATWTELSAFRKIGSRRMWFSPAELPFSAYVQAIALSPADPNVIVAGIEAGAVVRSADGGMTWTDHRNGALRDCHSMTFHAAHGDWIYEAGGTGAGASFSRDGGRTWTQSKAGLDRHYGWACAADPAHPEMCYFSASPGPGKAHGADDAQAYIFRSRPDGGWEKLTHDLPQPLNHMPYALLTDPAAPGHLYAGLSNGDVWHSSDAGDSWRKLPFSLKGIHRALIML